MEYTATTRAPPVHPSAKVFREENSSLNTNSNSNNNNPNGIVDGGSETSSSGKCQVDDRVTDCSIDNPCPEGSECVDSICCKLPSVARCANGLMSLTVPPTCRRSDECPISSHCESGKCCPFEKTDLTDLNTLDLEGDDDSGQGITLSPPASERLTGTSLSTSVTSVCLTRVVVVIVKKQFLSSRPLSDYLCHQSASSEFRLVAFAHLGAIR